jgi:hypothetical protein
MHPAALLICVGAFALCVSVCFSTRVSADKSVGIFGFSLENFLDVVTSLLIIWRFGGFSREALIVGDPVRSLIALSCCL